MILMNQTGTYKMTEIHPITPYLCCKNAAEAVADRFYGKRSGQLKDPFGHHWTISMHKEDVSPQELHRRAQQMFSEGG